MAITKASRNCFRFLHPVKRRSARVDDELDVDAFGGPADAPRTVSAAPNRTKSQMKYLDFITDEKFLSEHVVLEQFIRSRSQEFHLTAWPRRPAASQGPDRRSR